MNRIEVKDRFAEMWRRSRTNGGKSQDYMAKVLGVSKKTVQNWENGTSSPSQELGFEWFKALDLQPLPYYLNLLYPEVFNESLGADSDDEDIEKALLEVIKALPSQSKRKLLFFLTSSHGSSPIAMIELVVAHLHTDLRARLSVARSVINNYEVALETNRLVKPELARPNMELLRDAAEKGKQAVIEGKETYTSIL